MSPAAQTDLPWIMRHIVAVQKIGRKPTFSLASATSDGVVTLQMTRLERVSAWTPPSVPALRFLLVKNSGAGPNQQKTGRDREQRPRDVVTTAQVDNIELKYTGIRYDALTAGQQHLMRALIDTYLGRIRPGHDAVRRSEVVKRLSETHLGWIGQMGPNKLVLPIASTAQ